MLVLQLIEILGSFFVSPQAEALQQYLPLDTAVVLY